MTTWLSTVFPDFIILYYLTCTWNLPQGFKLSVQFSVDTFWKEIKIANKWHRLHWWGCHGDNQNWLRTDEMLFSFYPWVNERSGHVSSGTGGKAQPFPICSCRPVWGARFLSGLRSRRRRLWQGGFVRTQFRILNVTHIMVNGLARTSTYSYAHTHEPADPWRWLGGIDF